MKRLVCRRSHRVESGLAMRIRDVIMWRSPQATATRMPTGTRVPVTMLTSTPGGAAFLALLLACSNLESPLMPRAVAAIASASRRTRQMMRWTRRGAPEANNISATGGRGIREREWPSLRVREGCELALFRGRGAIYIRVDSSELFPSVHQIERRGNARGVQTEENANVSNTLKYQYAVCRWSVGDLLLPYFICVGGTCAVNIVLQKQAQTQVLQFITSRNLPLLPALPANDDFSCTRPRRPP